MTANRCEGSWGDGNVLELVMMVLQHLNTKKHLKMASFVFCEFYLNFLNGKSQCSNQEYHGQYGHK